MPDSSFILEGNRARENHYPAYWILKKLGSLQIPAGAMARRMIISHRVMKLYKKMRQISKIRMIRIVLLFSSRKIIVQADITNPANFIRHKLPQNKKLIGFKMNTVRISKSDGFTDNQIRNTLFRRNGGIR